MKTIFQLSTAILVILLFNINTLYSQMVSIDTAYRYDVKGKILRSDTKKYLAFADVSITYNGRLIMSTTTNRYGMFSFDFRTEYIYDPSGFQVRVIKSGYQEIIASNINLNPSEIEELKLTLTPKSSNFKRNSTVDLIDEIR